MAEIIVTFKSGEARKWERMVPCASGIPIFSQQVRAEPGFVIIDDGMGLRTWLPADSTQEIREDCRVR